MNGQPESATVYTIGHGNRSISEFLDLLQASQIVCLVDVRRWPFSRRHPQFCREALEKSLCDDRIRYVWKGETLGGQRRPVFSSPHRALQHESLRAYADHMTSEEFQVALRELIHTAREQSTAIMCAERLPRQCHRSLIADNLCVRGVSVNHIVEPGAVVAHRLDGQVRTEGDTLIYDRGYQPVLADDNGSQK